MSSAKNPRPERALLAAGTKTYFCADYEALDKVPEALREIVTTLKGLGFTTVIRSPGYRVNPNMRSLRADVEKAAATAPVVVVYYTGHGAQPSRSTYYLVSQHSRPVALRNTALAARDLLELLTLYDDRGDALPADQQPTVLVILDCCFSGAAGTTMLGEALRDIGNPNTWVIATAGALEYARQGMFAKAFCDELRRPTTGPSQRFVDPLTVVEAVNEALGHAQQALIFQPATGAARIPPFFPNPSYKPGLAGLTVADQQHWLSRVRGGPEESTTGFYLTGKTGRIRAAEHLAKWMTDPAPQGLAVVTGSPGAGKSALLALPVLLTEQSRRQDLLRAATPGSLVEHTASLIPVRTPVVAIHARGLNTDQIGGAIAQALGRDVGTASGLLEVLESAPQQDERVVIVDAIDEATSPTTLLAGLLVPLSRHRGVRLVVGGRRHVLAALGDINRTIDLDNRTYRDHDALTAYVYQLLIAAAEPGVTTCYQHVTKIGETEAGVAAAVAEAIAQRATAREAGAESFLIGRLLALAARDRPEPADITSPAWQSELPATVAEAFDADFARLGDKQSLARVLLEALAWAKGPGLPWENIWVPVAKALARRDGGLHHPTITNDDVRWLLDKAGAYVVEDLGSGQRSVFRPFHELLAMYLRGEPDFGWIDSDPTGERTWEGRRHWVEKAITDALLVELPANGVVRRNWEGAHPYLRTYLTQHAAAAGTEVLATLVQNIDFLAIANPVTLSPLLSPTVPELRHAARIYRRAWALLGDDAHANKAYLQEASIALTGTPAGPDDTGIIPLYRTRLESVLTDDSLLTLSSPRGGEPTSVAFGTTADGQLLLAAADGDTVLVWDPVTGSPIGKPFTGGQTDEIYSVAFGTAADGQLLLAAADGDTVPVWAPVTGSPIGKPLTKPGDELLKVAFGTAADGQLLLAAGGSDTVLVWDPVTGSRTGELLTGPGIVSSLVFGTTADGQLLLASGGMDGTVRLWDPVTGSPIGEPFTDGQTNEIYSVAFGTTADGQLLLASSGADGTVRLWDPVTGSRIGEPLTSPGGWVNSVAFGTTADGQLLLASGGMDGTVRLWDPITGSPVGQPFTGHGSGVTSLAFGTTADGQLLLASSGADGTVRLWDPVAGIPTDEPVIGPGRKVTSVAFGCAAEGQLLLASGCYDGTVRLWDPITGSPANEPLTGPGGWINEVAFGATADGQLLLASAGGDEDRDGIMRLWDPVTGNLVGEPFISPDHAIFSVALGRTVDGQFLLAAISNGTVRLWNPIASGPPGKPLPNPGIGANRVAFGTTAEDRLLLASGGMDGTVRLWDPIAGSPVGEPLISSANLVNAMAFGNTPDGQLLLAVGDVSDRRVWLWDPLTANLLGEPITCSGGGVNAVAFGTAADGQVLLAVAGGSTVQLWDFARKTCFMTVRRRCRVNAVAIAWPLVAIGDDEGVCVIEPLTPVSASRLKISCSQNAKWAQSGNPTDAASNAA